VTKRKSVLAETRLADLCRVQAETFEKRAEGLKALSQHVDQELFRRDIECLEALARSFRQREKGYLEAQ